MNLRVRTFLIALILVTGNLWAADEKMTDDDAAMLALVLRRSFDGGGYTVVSAETSLGPGSTDKVEQSKKYFTKEFESTGINVSHLIDRLYERNKKPVRLSLKSAPKEGYIVDYDGHYSKYFDKDGGGWEKWYKDNPKANGMTTVSLPIHDVKSRLVLVYTGTQSHWLAGSGWIVLYKYENGELKELKRVETYIS